MCRKTGSDRVSKSAQADHNCARPDFDTSTWTGKRLDRRYMGANPRYDREGKDKDWPAPEEKPEETGCPGAWYRTDFFDSVHRYYRNKDANGGRIANRALDICDDPLVIEAINTLETYEAAWLDKCREEADKKRNK